ncbi:MAG: hypothetical protein LBH43_01550 [Treponema sp.]|jgi:hypothetical protein|nr:hypothetical protein [Treponema sp.]
MATVSKKEKKFNGVRIARQVEKSLKAVFPSDTFFVSAKSNQVAVLYSAKNKCTVQEIGMFKTIFCNAFNLKIQELDFSSYESKAV